MSRIEITVNGEVFPCHTTMGAMLRFKRETGKEVSEITEWGLSDLCTFMWCCVASASRHEGKDFSLSLMDFADSISPEELSDWAASSADIQKGTEDTQEKKKA